MNRNWLTLFIVLMICVPLATYAQGNGGGNDPDTPIDGGLSLLLAAGAAYGVKRVARNKENTNNPA